MNKYTVTLWMDEMVFTRSAIQSSFDRMCREWRRTFIDPQFGAQIAEVYLPAIEALRGSKEEFDRVMPPV